MTFNGYMYVNNVLQSGICNDQFSVSLNSNTYYDFMVSYFDGIFGGGIIVWWSTPTISKQVIPSTYFVQPGLVGSSPYQITSSCPTGFYGNLASSLTQCATVCGDGIKAGSEACDDGNTISGDG